MQARDLSAAHAIAAGLTDNVWSVEELIDPLPKEEPKKRGPRSRSQSAHYPFPILFTLRIKDLTHHCTKQCANTG